MPLRSTWRPNKDEVVAQNGLVTAMLPQAAEAGLEMLKRGGNAVDAAVGVAFCNIVLEPYMASIAGIGFMLVHLAAQGKTVAIDFSTRAPRAARPDMYRVLGPAPAGGTLAFTVENDENITGARSVTIPATAAGLCYVHRLYGKLPLQQVMELAIQLAAEGFEANWHLTLYMANHLDEVQRNPVLASMWTLGGQPPRSSPKPGQRIVQRDLGEMLRCIARQGADALHKGEVAAAIEEAVRKGGGVLTRQDLEEYQPRVLEPLAVSYRGYTVLAVPTPHGAPTVMEALNILESFDLRSQGHNSAQYLHLLVEAARHAFADRYRFLGDWEHAPVPLRGLLDKGYARAIAGQVDAARAVVGKDLDREPWAYYLDRALHDPWKYDPSLRPGTSSGVAASTTEEGTTHINVVDREGNVVSCTHTGSGFRAHVIPSGTGVYLVAGMGWFVPMPGYANSIAPWKRPLMNMAPLLVLKEGKPVLAVGAPGARRIIHRITQVVLNVLEFGMGIQDAVAAPTVDASGREVLVDTRLPDEVAGRLKAMGHLVRLVEDEPGSTDAFSRPSGILLDHQRGLLHGGVDVFRPATALG